MAVLLNRVRSNFYLDSVALMRLSQTVSALEGVETAALMIGSETNKDLMRGAGLLNGDGETAGPNDLIIAVKMDDDTNGIDPLDRAEALLDGPTGSAREAGVQNPKSLAAALEQLPDANLALVSVPGPFAAREARQALGRGLNVMIFSDNVPLEDERALKLEARERGLLVMGPDCGTAIVAGAPLAFANEVPRGSIGIVAASGTGLQEVSTQIARAGQGISHAIGTGGRDLNDGVGGVTTLMAIDALDADPGTEHIVLISKPPGTQVTDAILERVGQSAKPFTICFIGLSAMALPDNATIAPTLKAAAELALGGTMIGADFDIEAAASAAATGLDRRRSRIRGLYSGGTLCAEAQLMLQAADEPVFSNAPVPGARPLAVAGDGGHTLIDLGADEYTVGRPHPMIDPAVRNDVLAGAQAEPDVAVILLDVVIGYGAHADPAGDLATVLAARPEEGPALVAAVCGTEGDPQVLSQQIAKLETAGVVVAPSNAQAAELAARISALMG